MLSSGSTLAHAGWGNNSTEVTQHPQELFIVNISHRLNPTGSSKQSCSPAFSAVTWQQRSMLKNHYMEWGSVLPCVHSMFSVEDSCQMYFSVLSICQVDSYKWENSTSRIFLSIWDETNLCYDKLQSKTRANIRDFFFNSHLFLQFLKSTLKPLKFLNLNFWLQLLKYEGVFSGIHQFSEALPSVVTFTDASPTICPMQTNTHTLSPQWTHMPCKSESEMQQ